MKKKKLTNEKKVKIIYNQKADVNRVKILTNIFEKKKISIQKVINKEIKKYVGKYAYIEESGQKIYFDKDLIGEYTYSNSTKNMTITNKLAKGRAVGALKEIVNNAKDRTWEANIKEKHSIDAKYGFYRYKTIFSFEYNGKEQIYSGTLLIRNDEDGKKYLYDILNIKKIGSNLPLVVSNSEEFNHI